MSKYTDQAIYKLSVLTTVVIIGAFFMGLFVWLPWTYMGMGTKYFSFLPSVWQSIPFGDCFWLSFLIMQFRNILGRVKVKGKK